MGNRIVILLIITLCLLGILALPFLPSFSATLEIVNRSEERMEDVTVSIAGRQFTLGDLESGDTGKVKVHDYSDDSWIIEGRWPDGSTISRQCGYITHNMSFYHVALFTLDREFKFESRN